MDSLRGHLLIAGSGLFDPNFRRVTKFGSFVDPKVPANYHPFGVQAINANTIVVTYAKHVPGEDVAVRLQRRRVRRKDLAEEPGRRGA